MKPEPLLVIGSLNMDLVIHTSRIPLSGETIMGSGYDESLGGKGANQAVGVARLGSQVRMIGCVGDDGFGQRLLSGIADAGVDKTYVLTVPGPSGLAIITHASSGANSIIVIAGANQCLDERALETHANIIQQSSILLLQLETPMPSVVRAAQIAHAAGVPVVLDPAPAQQLPPELLAAVTWITPNETEAAELLGISTKDLSLEAIADRLLALGTRNVILKLGERGCYIKGQDCQTPCLVPAFSVRAIDTTAAGDCFNAAFASQLVKGAAPADAARYANAAAAISVTRNGAQASMPDAQEVEALLSSR